MSWLLRAIAKRKLIQSEINAIQKPKYIPMTPTPPSTEISDEMVKDFIRKCLNSDVYDFIKKEWEKQQASHSIPERGWEIVSYNLNESILIKDLLNEGLFEDETRSCSEHFIKSKNGSIRSVRRLSDGEVFSIGDADNNYGKIVEFKIGRPVPTGNDQMFFTYERDNAPFDTKTFGESNICHLKKEKPEPVFTTHDQKQLFPKDKVYGINDDINDIREETLPFSDCRAAGGRRWYSSRELAEDSVVMDAKCLSLKDIHNMLIVLSQVNERDINKYDYNEQIKKKMFWVVKNKLQGGKQ